MSSPASTTRNAIWVLVIVGMFNASVAGCASVRARPLEQSADPSGTSSPRSNPGGVEQDQDDNADTVATTPRTADAPETTPVPLPSVPGRYRLDCASFGEATAFERMLSVTDELAPDDAECSDDVLAAEKADRVLAASAGMYRELAVGDFRGNLDAYSDPTCAEGSVSVEAKNVFSEPVVFWGAFSLLDTEGAVAYAPFVSDVVAPDDSVRVEADVSGADAGWLECFPDLRVLLAPVDSMYPDAGLVAAEAGDPQSATDPEVWYPALRAAEDEMFAVGNDPAAAANILIGQVEDIHSPDVHNVLELFYAADEQGSGPADAAIPLPPPSSDDGAQVGLVSAATAPEVGEFEICDIFDVTGERDQEGTLVLASFFSSSPELLSGRQTLGLFRRGSDQRWRYAGRTVNVSTPDTPEQGCAAIQRVAADPR